MRPPTVLDLEDSRAGADQDAVCDQALAVGGVLAVDGVAAVVDAQGVPLIRPDKEAGAVSDLAPDPLCAVALGHVAGCSVLGCASPHLAALAPDVAPLLGQRDAKVGDQVGSFNFVRHTLPPLRLLFRKLISVIGSDC